MLEKPRLENRNKSKNGNIILSLQNSKRMQPIFFFFCLNVSFTLRNMELPKCPGLQRYSVIVTALKVQLHLEILPVYVDASVSVREHRQMKGKSILCYYYV